MEIGRGDSFFLTDKDEFLGVTLSDEAFSRLELRAFLELPGRTELPGRAPWEVTEGRAGSTPTVFVGSEGACSLGVGSVHPLATEPAGRILTLVPIDPTFAYGQACVNSAWSERVSTMSTINNLCTRFAMSITL